MHEKQIRNILLAIVAALLLLNLGVMLAPPVHAVPKTQYKVVGVQPPSFGGIAAIAESYQQVLNQQGAQGWEYVGGGDPGLLIFKK